MPQPKLLPTHFDSPERSSLDELELSRIRLKDHEVVAQLLEGFPGLAVILDRNRQIVAYNSQARTVFRGLGDETVFGKRLGEALGCMHAEDEQGGCGTSKTCAECGAAQSIRLTNDTAAYHSRECRITTMLLRREGAMNVRVFTSPLQIDGEMYTLFTLKDIAQEKRLQALERIFFHDVLNTAAAVNSVSALMGDVKDPDELHELVGLIQSSSRQLIHEIHAQRDLLTAERGELAFVIEPITVNRTLSQVFELYKSHDLTHGKTLTVVPLEPDAPFESGVVHLVRSLGNLVKNALEASEPGQEVKVYAESTDRDVTFHVRSAPVMPDNVQLQVFQRSFSTKGSVGRGLGTYSVRLLVEQYLHGNVWFESNDEVGTIFSVKLPRKFKRK